MVSKLQPLNIFFHELVVFPVFLRRPVVVWIFFPLWIITVSRAWKRTWTLTSIIIRTTLDMLFFHFIFGIAGAAIASCICSWFISWSLRANLLILGLVTDKDLVVLRDRIEIGWIKWIEIYILRRSWWWGKGIISVVLIQLLE